MLRVSASLVAIALLIAQPTVGQQLSHWSSGSNADVYLLDSPAPPQPLTPVQIAADVGDTFFVDAVGCVNVPPTGWVAYVNPPGNQPLGTIWIPGNTDTGGDHYTAVPLRDVLNKPLIITVTPSFKGIMLGYGPGQQKTFSYDPGAIVDPACQNTPHAMLTVTVVHSDANIMAGLLAVPPANLNFRFDTLANPRLDVNSIAQNPIFYGQIEACQIAAWASSFFGNKPIDLKTCLSTGYPFAESACNGFPLLSVDYDDTAPKLVASSHDFANLIVVDLLKDMWALNHGGDLTCPSLDYDPCALAGTGKLCPRWATCSATDVSDDNRDNCAACYFQPWNHPSYTANLFNYQGRSYLLADQDLDDDIHKLQALQNDPTFSNLPESKKIVAVAPIVDRWWPIVDTRWHFSEVKDTRTSPIDHTEENSCRSETVRTDTSSICAVGHIFYGNGAGSVYGLGGHTDFQTASYEGRLWFEDHSPATPDFGGYDDDDISWDILPMYGEGSSGGEKWVHVERSAWSSLRLFRTNQWRHDFWTGLADAVDQDNGARMSFEALDQPGTSFYPNANVISYLEQALPANERTNPQTEPEISVNKCITIDASGKEVPCPPEQSTYALPAVNHAIVTGNLSLDCYHGCNPELHPAYLMALRIRTGSFSEKGPSSCTRTLTRACVRSTPIRQTSFEIRFSSSCLISALSKQSPTQRLKQTHSVGPAA